MNEKTNIHPFPSNDSENVFFDNKSKNFDMDDQTVQTMGTAGTMHRRRNSTSIFTVDSLAQIFQNDNINNDNNNNDNTNIRNETQQQQHHRQYYRKKLNVSASYEVIPDTIRKIRRRVDNGDDDDDQSLISPLGDNDDNSCFFQSNDVHGERSTNGSLVLRNRLDSCDSSIMRRASTFLLTTNKSDVYQPNDEVIDLPPEPKGTYMPTSSVFKQDIEDGHCGCSLEGWVSSVPC